VEVLSFDGAKLTQKSIIKAGLTSALLHLDWSEDSQAVVINSEAYELKFVNVESGSMIRASAARGHRVEQLDLQARFSGSRNFPRDRWNGCQYGVQSQKQGGPCHRR
jgi:hypothetical protein